MAARALATVAALLAEVAGSAGGLRSGPAKFPDWQVRPCVRGGRPAMAPLTLAPPQPALQLVLRGDMAVAVAALRRLRLRWMNTPERVMRAARHYDGAAAVRLKACRACARRLTAARRRDRCWCGALCWQRPWRWPRQSG